MTFAIADRRLDIAPPLVLQTPGENEVDAISGMLAGHDLKDEFVCPIESGTYSAALRRLVFSKGKRYSVDEFGTGTGAPLVLALRGSGFRGVVRGFETNKTAVTTANSLIHRAGLQDICVVRNQSFFCPDREMGDVLIANPPFLPAHDQDSLRTPSLPILADLYGGPNGNELSKDLLNQGYSTVMMLVASISDPVSLIEDAQKIGFGITDFQVTNIPFGQYSRQSPVQSRLRAMVREGKAFCTNGNNGNYMIGCALFQQDVPPPKDQSKAFLRVMTSLGIPTSLPTPIRVPERSSSIRPLVAVPA
jgi:hypothetical protein